MASFNSIYILMLFTILDISYAKKIPSFIKRCEYSTDGVILGKCIQNIFFEYKDKFIVGIPEMHIPVLDPFEVNEIDFNTGSGSTIGLESKFSNVQIYGTRDVMLEKINIDVLSGLCELDVYLPNLRITSNYKLTGKIMIMNLDGSGYAEGNFTDIRSTNHYKGKFVTRHGKEYIEWYDRKLQLSIGGANMYFHDLFKDNKEMTETTNKIINDNSDAILGEVKPLVEETISAIMFTILQNVFHTFSVDELFIKQ